MCRSKKTFWTSTGWQPDLPMPGLTMTTCVARSPITRETARILKRLLSSDESSKTACSGTVASKIAPCKRLTKKTGKDADAAAGVVSGQSPTAPEFSSWSDVGVARNVFEQERQPGRRERKRSGRP